MPKESENFIRRFEQPTLVDQQNTRNSHRNVRSISSSSGGKSYPLIKITSYQLSFLATTALSSPLTVYCASKPKLCADLDLSVIRILLTTALIPICWAVSSIEFRLYMKRKIKSWIY